MAQSLNKEYCLSLSDLAKLMNWTEVVALKKLKNQFPDLATVNYLMPEVVREFLNSQGIKYPSKVLSFQMLKGGVAKTTSALNFGLRAAMYGARVLFIDLDQQANLTFALGVESEALPVWLDVVEKRKQVQDVRLKLDCGVDLVPSNLNNSVLDRTLMQNMRNWPQSVKANLTEVKSEYDLIIIDTAPNLSLINTAVTIASNEVILPVNPDRFSFLGLKRNLQDLNDLKKEFNLDFQPRVLFTKFDAREGASKSLLSFCLQEYGDLLLQNYVRTSTEIKNVIGTNRGLFSSPSKAKEDYDAVTREILNFPLH